MKSEATKKPRAKKTTVKKAAKKTVAKKVVVTTPTNSSENETKYFMTLEVNNEVFEARADTITECLDQMNTGQLKTKGVIYIETQDGTASTALTLFQLKRLFMNKVAKIIFEKKMNSLIK